MLVPCRVVGCVYLLSDSEDTVWLSRRSLPSVQASHLRQGARLSGWEGSHPCPQLEAESPQERRGLRPPSLLQSPGPAVRFPRALLLVELQTCRNTPSLPGSSPQWIQDWEELVSR